MLVLTSAKELSKTYCDTANNLKNAVTDLSNATVLSRTLRTTNEKLELKLEELQRSIVSRAPYQYQRALTVNSE